MPSHPARAAKNDLDALLLDILSSIATILVSTGYGFSRANKLAKIAFVRAARSVVLETGSKSSIARIAALTGLTRIDVSRVIQSLDSARPMIASSINRAARVARGWVTDGRFSQRNSKPRLLAFVGPGDTFSALVRQYSGDIPAKAMLIEMTRLGMVRQDTRGYLMLVRSDVAKSRRTTRALNAAIPWISFLASASKAHTEREFVFRSDKFKLHFSSHRQVFEAMHELQVRRRAFVAALKQLGSPRNRRAQFSLNISVAAAASAPPDRNLQIQVRPKAKRASPRK